MPVKSILRYARVTGVPRRHTRKKFSPPRVELKKFDPPFFREKMATVSGFSKFGGFRPLDCVWRCGGVCVCVRCMDVICRLLVVTELSVHVYGISSDFPVSYNANQNMNENTPHNYYTSYNYYALYLNTP